MQCKTMIDGLHERPGAELSVAIQVKESQAKSNELHDKDLLAIERPGNAKVRLRVHGSGDLLELPKLAGRKAGFLFSGFT